MNKNNIFQTLENLVPSTANQRILDAIYDQLPADASYDLFCQRFDQYNQEPIDYKWLGSDRTRDKYKRVMFDRYLRRQSQ